MKKIIFIFAILLFPNISLAKQIYFDFNLPASLLVPGSEVSVNFNYSIKGADEDSFNVIPVPGQALIEIYNEETGVWNRQGELRSGFPKLKPEMKIKSLPFSDVKTSICFDIQYSKTSEIYQTPCKTYWNRDHFKQYMAAINVKILRWVKEKTVK